LRTSLFSVSIQLTTPPAARVDNPGSAEMSAYRKILLKGTTNVNGINESPTLKLERAGEDFAGVYYFL
jgi:hypothetical protein